MIPLMALMGAQTLSSAFSSYQGGEANRSISRSNARIKRMQAEDVRKRGHEAEAQTRQKYKKTVGSQRAQMAAQGLNLDIGSPMDIQQETQDVGELDALTIQNNAARAAFGYTTDAMRSDMEGDLYHQQGVNAALDTLLSGGIQAYGQYQSLGKLKNKNPLSASGYMLDSPR